MSACSARHDESGIRQGRHRRRNRGNSTPGDFNGYAMNCSAAHRSGRVRDRAL